MTTGLISEIRSSRLIAALVVACIIATSAWAYFLAKVIL